MAEERGGVSSSVKIPTDPASIHSLSFEGPCSKMPPRKKETGETSSASKRQKKQQQRSSTVNENNTSSRDDDGVEDRISCLPDTILHHILSCLDMKHAVQTTILSKRWTDLWTSLRSLKLDSELFRSPTEEKGCVGFHNFVDQVFILRDNSDIDTFHLINIYPNCKLKNSRLNTWITSVLRRKVQQFFIDVLGDGVRLPNRLFTCNTLTRMTLSLAGNERWSITLPAAPADSDSSSSMCLPNLWDLQLYSVSFHDENLTNNFFLSCPNLKRLALYDVEFLHMNVNISALKLMTLIVDNHGKHYGYCHWPNTKFKLHAPNLSCFICKDFLSRDYIMGNLPSLVEAYIYMKVEEEDQQHPAGLYSMLPVEKKQMYAQRMMQFLKALHYVEDLKLSAWFLEVVSGSSDLFESEPTQLCDLTCLRLKTWLSGDTIHAITYLLNISPDVESLFLEIIETKFGSSNIGENPEAEVSLQCLLDKLELVEIRGAIGCVNELKFLEMLLKNAKILKKLVVYTSKEDSPDREKHMMRFTEKLLTFSKASSYITILFF